MLNLMTLPFGMKLSTLYSEIERKIIFWICKGLERPQLADKMNLCQKTIDWHRNKINFKSHTGNSVELLHYAIRVGLYSMEEFLSDVAARGGG